MSDHSPPPNPEPDPSPSGECAGVRRRLVCFLSGFDPQGPPRYHSLYSTEAPKQAAVSGYQVSVGKRKKQGDLLTWWDVKAEFGPHSVDTRYEVLRWDDIVRDHWPRGRWALFLRTLYGSGAMWTNGVMWASMKTSWPMFVAIALPGAMLMVLGAVVLGLLGSSVQLVTHGHPWLAALLLLIGSPSLIWLSRIVEQSTHMGWLMRSLACLARQGKGQTPELENRLNHFAQHVAEQAQSGAWDEVLVAGHSSGAMMAMIVTARALQHMETARQPPSSRLALLTLGHCSPLLSYQPEATGFRQELAILRDANALTWIDYGAPPDGCCFPLVDPTAVAAGTATRTGHPKLLNPRFAQHFTSTTYQALRKDKFHCHLQYLMATELPGDYDYFGMTAGPLGLHERHLHRPSITHFKQFQLLGGPRL